jgi:diguanylate cyclase (GGDEF)-like protein
MEPRVRPGWFLGSPYSTPSSDDCRFDTGPEAASFFSWRRTGLWGGRSTTSAPPGPAGSAAARAEPPRKPLAGTGVSAIAQMVADQAFELLGSCSVVVESEARCAERGPFSSLCRGEPGPPSATATSIEVGAESLGEGPGLPTLIRHTAWAGLGAVDGPTGTSLPRPRIMTAFGRTCIGLVLGTHQRVRMWIWHGNERTLTAAEVAHLQTLVLLLALEIVHRRQVEMLSAWSLEDPLTGLMNRRGLRLAAKVAMGAHQACGREVGVIVTDVDGLKHVNDSLGHASGDQLLKAVARLLTRTFATVPERLVARTGGDEFCVLVAGATPASVKALAHQLRRGGRRLPHRGRLSIGLCLASEVVGADFDALYAAADAAQCEAKRAGGDRVYDRQPSETAGADTTRVTPLHGGAGHPQPVRRRRERVVRPQHG